MTSSLNSSATASVLSSRDAIEDREVFIKITLANNELSFLNTNWGLLEESLREKFNQWIFIAFNNQQRSAIIQLLDKNVKDDIILIKQIQIDNKNVDVELEETNGSNKKGIIYHFATIPMTVEYILDKLKEQGVIEAFKLEKVVPFTNSKVYTGSVILIFDKKKSPDIHLP